MTPFELEILLHYHSRACDFREGDFSAPIVIPTLASFVDKGLLQRPGPCEGMQFGPTEKLHVFIEYLLKQPLPVRMWIIPKE